MLFTVVAGRYEPEGDENCKVVHPFPDLEQALDLLDTCADYPWSRVEIQSADGRRFELVEIRDGYPGGNDQRAMDQQELAG